MTRTYSTMTDRQRDLLDALAMFVDEHGYPPSHRDLADLLGVTHTHVTRIIEELRKTGRVATTPGVARSIRMIPPTMRA